MRRPLCVCCMIFCILFAGVMYFIPLPVYPYEDGQWILGTGTVVCQQNKENQTTLIIKHVSVTEMSYQEIQSIISGLFNQTNSQELLLTKKELLSAMECIPRVKIQMQIKLYQEYNRDYIPGQVIVYRGKYKAFREATNPGMFHQKQYENSSGIGFSLTDVSIVASSSNGNQFSAYLSALKSKYQSVYERFLGEQAKIMCAMILGERWNIDADTKELYRQSGMIHVLSISSLHISILGMFILKICHMCHIRKKLQIAITACVVCCYASLCGGSPSTYRALFMFFLALFAKYVGRTYDILSALALSFVVLLLYQPFYIYHTGFWMSFMAVLGVSLFYPILVRKEMKTQKKSVIKRFNALKKQFLASFSVNLAICPILLNGYYELAPYSLIWNLFVIPAMSVVLCSGFLGGGVGVGFPNAKLTYYLLLPGRKLLEAFEKISQWQSTLPGARWIIGKPHFWQMILYYCIFFLMIIFGTLAKNLQKKKTVIIQENTEKKKMLKTQYLVLLAGILALFIVLLVPGWVEKTKRVSVTMLDVGQGDCFVIQAKGSVFLVDGGSSSEKQIAKYRIEPFLKSQGIGKVDICFVSHSDADHTNGILECLQNQQESGITYKALCLTSCAKKKPEEYAALCMAAKMAKSELLYISAGDQVQGKGCKINCLWPRSNCEASDENDCSMVLTFSNGELCMLFLGDASRGVERKLSIQEQVDILKVSHHGSKTGSDQEFVAKLSPQVALISCGRNNSYNHPHKETLETLNKYGVYFRRTDQSGAVVVDFLHGSILE